MDAYGARETDMTIDNSNNLHLAFYLKQDGSTGYLYYGKYDGSSWLVESLQDNVHNNQIRIVLDGQDPHIFPTPMQATFALVLCSNIMMAVIG